jgi:hypothetical protein
MGGPASRSRLFVRVLGHDTRPVTQVVDKPAWRTLRVSRTNHTIVMSFAHGGTGTPRKRRAPAGPILAALISHRCIDAIRPERVLRTGTPAEPANRDSVGNRGGQLVGDRRTATSAFCLTQTPGGRAFGTVTPGVRRQSKGCARGALDATDDPGERMVQRDSPTAS